MIDQYALHIQINFLESERSGHRLCLMSSGDSCLTAVTGYGTRDLVNIALRRFLHYHGNIATEGIVTEGISKSGLCPSLIK